MILIIINLITEKQATCMQYILNTDSIGEMKVTNHYHQPHFHHGKSVSDEATIS